MSKQITTTVYTYDELTGKAKDAARQWLKDAILYDDWWDTTIEFWKHELEKVGFTNAAISFSGFASQGDGASFTSDIDLGLLANIDAKYRRLKSLGGYMYPCHVVRTSHQYSHENTCRVDISFERYGRADKVEALLGAFVTDAEELRYDLCRAIYRDLEADYWDRISDESIADFAANNEYTFTATGRRF